MSKDLRILDRHGAVVSQGSFNVLMSELDRVHQLRDALVTVGCRAIPKRKNGCGTCVVCEALRRVPVNAASHVPPIPPNGLTVSREYELTVRALTAAYNALRAYQYGNADPTLAEETADYVHNALESYKLSAAEAPTWREIESELLDGLRTDYELEPGFWDEGSMRNFALSKAVIDALIKFADASPHPSGSDRPSPKGE